MRRLLPEPSDHVDLHAAYGEDWLADGGLRVNFVSSVDGGASVDGRSGGLQTPGDNAVFAALRALADVVLVGAGTAAGEGYGAIHPSGSALAARREHGLADSLPVAVISRSLRLDPGSALFTDADDDARTVVLTCSAADPGTRDALAEVADVVLCGSESVEPARARAALHERGHRRILSEGGPSEFARLAAGGVVDELCLSLSPLLAGPGAGRVVGGEAWNAPLPLRLHSLFAEDDALFCRYRLTATD